ncbi:DUF1127 domain-containing protein [Lutibaculum baratangense]|uniref:YjiS-like domain-containing protein n=1 Tax=Lutibaculum baratangense AMV1 TaxID=631454 RepID=V4QST2_9HYPH|nr:DUF1127 domain-containing protein [Lutibaculum baratangense]ESR22832.1 hypothetical protein N177_3969 [Lutibaculum baratangense AMV1]
MTMISGPVAQGTAGRTEPFAPRLTDFLRKLIAERRERAQLKLRRQAFRNLLELDDKTLNDIGFTRYEVEDAASLPLEVNASLALREMARKRREREIKAFRRR